MLRSVNTSAIAATFMVFAIVQIGHSDDSNIQSADFLTHLIKNVRANEALYANIEISTEESYDIGTRNPVATTFGDEIQSSKQEIVSVTQGKLFRMERTGKSRSAVKSVPMDRTIAFDGVKTRLFEGRVANVILGKSSESAIVLPHTTIFRDREYSFPLSAYLCGSSTIRPLVNEGRWSPDLDLDVTYEGEESVDGLACHKIFVNVNYKGSPHNGDRIWLAESRNYLPLLNHSFTYRHSRDIPIAISQSSDLREIASGIWLEAVSKLAKNDNQAGKKNKTFE